MSVRAYDGAPRHPLRLQAQGGRAAAARATSPQALLEAEDNGDGVHWSGSTPFARSRAVKAAAAVFASPLLDPVADHTRVVAAAALLIAAGRADEPLRAHLMALLCALNHHTIRQAPAARAVAFADYAALVQRIDAVALHPERASAATPATCQARSSCARRTMQGWTCPAWNTRNTTLSRRSLRAFSSRNAAWVSHRRIRSSQRTSRASRKPSLQPWRRRIACAATVVLKAMVERLTRDLNQSVAAPSAPARRTAVGMRSSAS